MSKRIGVLNHNNMLKENMEKVNSDIVKMARETTMSLEEATFEKSRVRLSSIQYDGKDLNDYAILGIKPPSKDGAGIALTNEQREAIIQLGKTFKGLAEVMLTAMQGILKPMNDLADAILKLPELQKPEPSFAKKKKPWKRDRFYD